LFSFMPATVLLLTASGTCFHEPVLTKLRGVSNITPWHKKFRGGFPILVSFSGFQRSPLPAHTSWKILEQAMLLLPLMAKHVSSDRTENPAAGFGANSSSRRSRGRSLALWTWLCLISSCCHAPKQARPTAALPFCSSTPEIAVTSILLLFQHEQAAHAVRKEKEL